VKKLIFGSAGARKRGGLAKETADRQFLASLLILEEYCSRYRMQVLLEAIRVGEADYINTLSEGAEMVILAQKAGCTHIALMADLFHMNSNGEDCLDLKKYFPLIRHIHICETERKLPSQLVSNPLRQETELLQSLHYNLTASYESIMPVNDAHGKQALSLLKSMLHESPQE
jgi:sugar phosphate isomerase/epimerase